MVFINRQILIKVTIQVSRRFTDDFRIDILKNVGLFIFMCLTMTVSSWVFMLNLKLN